MKIAVIGTGSVGQALAGGWRAAGHEVVFGSRTAGGGPDVRTIPDAIAASSIVVLAVPYPAVADVVRSAGGGLAGKVVIDCTNPLKPDLSGLAIGPTTSAAEQIADLAPRASVFKAFNQTGAENMTGRARYPTKPVMFVCGNDAARKPDVLRLTSDLGFEAIDAGDLTVARLLEPMAMLWIHLVIKQKLDRHMAFALVHPEGS